MIDNKTVAKMAKEKQTFTFQAAANHFDCGTLALFSMIDKNQLTYNPQTGYYKYIGA